MEESVIARAGTAGGAAADPALDAPTRSPVQVGALVPLSRPGWPRAGRNLLAGLRVAAAAANRAGGVSGRPIHLVVRDTAGSPERAANAVDELAALGVAAVAGEYHSVAARAAAARADACGVPFLCSSAVLDRLVEEATDWVARLAPAQSYGWGLYAEFLADEGHTCVALAVQRSPYWASGALILRTQLARRGVGVIELDLEDLTADSVCTRIAEGGATAILVLTAYPDPAIPLVRAVRRHDGLRHLFIGAPAGQPEFDDWLTLLGTDAGGIPFLRYLPDRLDPRGVTARRALSEQVGADPSFVAFEGYDTMSFIVELMRSCGTGRDALGGSWGRVALEGTRGTIRFTRDRGMGVWQWRWAPVQIVDRDPADPSRIRVLRSSAIPPTAPGE